MKIGQHGHKVTRLVIKRTLEVRTDKRISETFILDGRIRDRFFYGYIYPEGHGRLSALAFLYQVEGCGTVLKCQRVFYHIRDSEIKSAEERWEKQK